MCMKENEKMKILFQHIAYDSNSLLVYIYIYIYLFYFMCVAFFKCSFTAS
jgi:hypothetical protein